MNIQDFKAKLFELGQQHEFTDMELYFEREENFGCELFQGEIDKYDTSEVSGASFRGIFNGQMGYAFTEILDEESLSYLIENAKENALIIDDEDAEEIFSGSKNYENIDFYSKELKSVSIEQKISLLKEIEKEIFQYDKRVTGTDYFELVSRESERSLMNSKGLNLQEKKNYLALYISVVVKEQEQVKTGLYFKVIKDFASLNAKIIAKQAVEEALSQLGAKSIDSKKYPVVLRNDVAANLLGTFSPIFSSENTQKGRSLLKDKVGESIAAPTLRIIDDPLLNDGMASRTFDSEGVATKTQPIVENGKLISLLYNLKTAKKEGTVSTGHAFKPSYKGTITVSPSNLYIEPSSKSFDEIVGTINEGVLITGLSGLHSGANAVSGDFSVAATGFYIKDGKINTAINQATIAGNFYDVLKNIEEIGSDLNFTPPFMAQGYVGSPSLKIKHLSVTVE